jgi:hypothetical protein
MWTWTWTWTWRNTYNTADEVTLSVDFKYKESTKLLLAANILDLRDEPTLWLIKICFKEIIRQH